MRGHIRKKGTSWQACVKMTDPATGERRQLTRTRKTKGEAERELLKLLAQAGRSSASATSATVAGLLDAWQDLNAATWSPGTVRQTRSRVARYVVPRLGKVKVSKLRTSDLELLYAELRRSGGVGGRELSPATVRKVHNDLSSALAQAVRWEWLESNPAARVDTRRLLTGGGRPIKPPALVDVARLLEGARDADADFGAWLYLAAATGARRGELCALRWSDLDLEAGTVRIERAIALGDGAPIEKSTKTGNRRRISLGAGTLAVVRAHRRRVVARALAAGGTVAADAFVFSLELDGATSWRPELPTHRFVRLREDLGLESVRLHDLRHFSVTQMLAAGVDLATVAARHGHAGGGRTTLAVYGHLVEAADRSAAEHLDALLAR